MTTTKPALPEPFDWCYEWDGPYGTRKFSAASHNGMKPARSVPIYRPDQMHAYADQCTAAAQARIAELEAELDRERMSHAACGVIAMSNTRESAAQQRQMKPEYWSASCGDVAKAVDREMDYRERLAALLDWAVSRWRDEVEHRPLVNTKRRSLDDTWRQVIRFAGGNPDELIGPSHDALLAARAALASTSGAGPTALEDTPCPGCNGPRSAGPCCEDCSWQDKPRAASPPVVQPEAANKPVDLMALYKQACDLADWANAQGTIMGNERALCEASAKLRDMLGAATLAASPPSPAQPAPPNRCKLIQCRSKPRCAMCLEMDAAYPQPAPPSADARDAARLDFLEGDAMTRVFKIGKTWYWKHAYGQPHRKAKSLRVAIDSAMASNQEPKAHWACESERRAAIDAAAGNGEAS